MCLFLTLALLVQCKKFDHCDLHSAHQECKPRKSTCIKLVAISNAVLLGYDWGSFRLLLRSCWDTLFRKLQPGNHFGEALYELSLQRPGRMKVLLPCRCARHIVMPHGHFSTARVQLVVVLMAVATRVPGLLAPPSARWPWDWRHRSTARAGRQVGPAADPEG